MIKAQTEKSNMKVYRFKCKDCGATKYEKIDDTKYMCEYCGYIEEVYFKKENQQETENEPKQEEPVQEETPTFEIFEHLETKHISAYDIVMLVLTIVFGYLGIQHFMKGRIVVGLVYLFTYGVFCIGWGLDAIRELIRFVKKSRGNY